MLNLHLEEYYYQGWKSNYESVGMNPFMYMCSYYVHVSLDILRERTYQRDREIHDLNVTLSCQNLT